MRLTVLPKKRSVKVWIDGRLQQRASAPSTYLALICERPSDDLSGVAFASCPAAALVRAKFASPCVPPA